MDGAVGVRGAVVQDVDGRTLARLADAIVNVHLAPRGEPFGLVLRQVGLHREIGLGQVQRCLKF